jgi:hypothetical protein
LHHLADFLPETRSALSLERTTDSTVSLAKNRLRRLREGILVPKDVICADSTFSYGCHPKDPISGETTKDIDLED